MLRVLDGRGSVDPTIDFIAGLISGIASLLVGHPFDTVKVRFQNPDTAWKYSSTVHAIVTIIREERFIGLYKGITSSLVSVAFMNGFIFSAYAFFLKLQSGSGEMNPTLTQVFVAGTLGGIVCSIFTAPIELIKIRQQSCLTPTSTIQVTLQILKEQGLAGLLCGLTATALRESNYGIYFFVYEATLRYLSVPDPGGGKSALGSWPVLLAGGLAGPIAWASTFPFDVVKTRIQGGIATLPTSGFGMEDEQTQLLSSDPLLVQTNPYRSVYSTIVYSYQTEGIGTFFHGLVPTLIRAIPVSMALFGTYEGVVYLLA